MRGNIFTASLLLIVSHLAFCFTSGCTINNRSVVTNTINRAEPLGKIDNKPVDSSTGTVNAEKTTEMDTAVSTSSGRANANRGEKTTQETESLKEKEIEQ